MTTMRKTSDKLVLFDECFIWNRDVEHCFTPTELSILWKLKRYEGRPVANEILVTPSSKEPAYYGCGNPKFHISSLRKKLGHSPDHPIILNRRGIGYYLVPGAIRFYKCPIN
ncbi:MAG: helix-turn-helix domain-containing protein [Syntrophomonadaceae bacterium]|nr:helix-turn-helix domain-containing protein [Syntrophomonadaceae bacterium]